MQTAAIVVVWALVVWLLIAAVRRMVHRHALKRMNDMQYATVVYVVGTGSYTNHSPDLLVTLEYTSPEGQSYRRDITRSFSLAQIPRRGDRMSVWVNPNDPSDFDIADKNPLPPGFNG